MSEQTWTKERIAEIKRIRNCVPFIEPNAGCDETQAAFDELIAYVERMSAFVARAKAIEEAARDAVTQFNYIIQMVTREPYPNMLGECQSRRNELDAALALPGGGA